MTTATLSAWSVQTYGGPQVLAPVHRPVAAPEATEVLIRIRASAVTRADGMMRAGKPKFARLFLGLKKPHADLSGTCLSGEVIAVGAAVTRFAVGDEVFGLSGMKFGTNATHITLEEDGALVKKPATLTHEEAAVMGDGAMTSWHFLNHVGQVKPGDRVLILAGAGSLGSAAVQFAAAMGAHVTATASARNAKLLSDLGADETIDYAETDGLERGADYDVIFDTIGVASFGAAKKALIKGGRFISPVLTLGLLRDLLTSRLFGSKTAHFAAAGLVKPEQLRVYFEQIIDLSRAGKFAPLMDRTYPLSDLVEAHSYVETGHKRGNVVVV